MENQYEPPRDQARGNRDFYLSSDLFTEAALEQAREAGRAYLRHTQQPYAATPTRVFRRAPGQGAVETKPDSTGPSAQV